MTNSIYLATQVNSTRPFQTREMGMIWRRFWLIQSAFLDQGLTCTFSTTNSTQSLNNQKNQFPKWFQWTKPKRTPLKSKQCWVGQFRIKRRLSFIIARLIYLRSLKVNELEIARYPTACARVSNKYSRKILIQEAFIGVNTMKTTKFSNIWIEERRHKVI